MRRLRILAVDDDPDALELLVVTLEAYDVTAVGSAPEAVELLRAREFDLIVSDWKMPEIDGVELLKWAHGHISQTMGCILITGRPEDFATVTQEDARRIWVLAKPASAAKLIDYVERLGALVRIQQKIQEDRKP